MVALEFFKELNSTAPPLSVCILTDEGCEEGVDDGVAEGSSDGRGLGLVDGDGLGWTLG